MPRVKLTNDGVVVSIHDRVFQKQLRKSSNLSIHAAKKLANPKIAIQRGPGIGDVLTTTPILHGIKNTFKCDITYVTNLKYLDGALPKVLKYNLDIDRIIDYSKFNASNYNAVVNLDCNCAAHENKDPPSKSRIDLFAEHIRLDLVDFRPQYFVAQDELNLANSFLSTITYPIIMVQPFASNPKRSLDGNVLKQALTKLWKEHHIGSLIITHGLIWKPGVDWSEVPGSIIIADPDIREIGALMPLCNLVLCPDSSLLHLAAALSVPTVAIFGPTDPAARINHYPQAIAIWAGDRNGPCPCWSKHDCPIDYTCWNSITSDMIYEACMSHISYEHDISSLPIHIPDHLRIQTEII